MTIRKAVSLPDGTKVMWNKPNSIDHGDVGVLNHAMCRIDWDDGEYLNYTAVRMRWVKEVKQ